MRSVIRAIFIALVLLYPTDGFSLPENWQVESGQATVEKPNDTTLNITASDKAVINFNSFNIAQNETVNIIQPSSSASLLSRVTGPDATQINGNLNANGNFFLVNTHGINFGASANIQANSFVASTLAISTNNFINSSYIFEHAQNECYSQIINEGSIT